MHSPGKKCFEASSPLTTPGGRWLRCIFLYLQAQKSRENTILIFKFIFLFFNPNVDTRGKINKFRINNPIYIFIRVNIKFVMF